MKFRLSIIALFAALTFQQASAQKLLERVDSLLTHRYHKGNIDTDYVIRPKTKWTIRARWNVSGSQIESEGISSGGRFKSKMKAHYKSTLSLGVGYLGFSVNLSINPAKLLGKYHDTELNFSSFGRRFGFDFVYQDAKNFTGWYEQGGMGRIDLPEDIMSVKTLNMNAYYAFNSRRFSYPAAFTQSYIQRRSAGSFLLAASLQGQRATIKWGHELKLKMTNIGIGAGYGYNFVPSQGWLLHISALPTFIFYSHTSMTYDDEEVSMHYHFPEVIITGRGAVVHQMKKTFFGLSMVFNFTNIGHKDNLTIYNTKWHVRTFYGLRL